MAEVVQAGLAASSMEPNQALVQHDPAWVAEVASLCRRVAWVGARPERLLAAEAEHQMDCAKSVQDRSAVLTPVAAVAMPAEVAAAWVDAAR